MARRLIGADIDAGHLRVVCLEQSRQGERLLATARRPIDGIEAAAAELAALVEEWAAHGARIALALPAERLLARELEFPFRDRRKIAQSAPLALAAQLPGDFERRLTVALPARPTAEGAKSLVLSLPEEEVAAFLAPFDQRQLAVRVLEVLPFAAAAGLAPADFDGVLVLLRESGGVAVRVVAGQPGAHLLLPAVDGDETLQARSIVRAVRSLPGPWPCPSGVLVCGPGLSAAGQRALVQQLPEARVPEVAFDGSRLAAEFLPALALARRAAASTRAAGCNLRRGPFAYRGSLAPYRRSLIASGVMLALALAALIAAFWIGYAGKQARYERLQQELLAIYRQALPGAPPVADIPLYLTRHLERQQAEGRLLGGGAQRPVPVLDALSRAVAAVPSIAIDEWNYDPDRAQLAGQGARFDDVDRLAAQLGESPLFAAVQIVEVKSSLDGQRVDFRIDLRFAGSEVEP